ncbi:unnamed protein product [Enterobius vermicularis]|uniref:Uncharacterized protein n=1 Tax=Enterobius vermicularis TaxID=51028 RepID=A0A0N4V015_ENTVE|nr:unnamed protein product [Enterobius vermicularis]
MAVRRLETDKTCLPRMVLVYVEQPVAYCNFFLVIVLPFDEQMVPIPQINLSLIFHGFGRFMDIPPGYGRECRLFEVIQTPEKLQVTGKAIEVTQT